MLRAVGMTAASTTDDPPRKRHDLVDRSRAWVPVGVFLAAMATSALSRYDIVFSLPVTLSSLSVMAIALGMLAAILPARRARG